MDSWTKPLHGHRNLLGTAAIQFQRLQVFMQRCSSKAGQMAFIEKSDLRMNKEAMLSAILAQNPDDAFARYGLAMEYASSGKPDAALREFEHLLSRHPDYTPGYFMAAQTLAKEGRNQEACERLRQGISSADRTGNQHAKGEMQAMLDELEFQS